MKDNGEKGSKWNIQTDGHNHEWHIEERFVKNICPWIHPQVGSFG